MTSILRILLTTFLAAFVLLCPAGSWAQEQTKAPQPQQRRPRVVQPQPEEPEEYTEEEYDAMIKATQEPDPEKRVQMLQDFIAKYPQSKLMPYITASYMTTLYDLSNAQKWDKLQAAADYWLKSHPDDPQVVPYAATAAEKLGQDEKYLGYALKIYAQNPSARLALSIQQSYKRLKNDAKYLEWTEKLFAFPEFDGDFGIRMTFVEKYAKEERWDKAAEYAQKALAALVNSRKPDGTSDAEWNRQLRAVRRACYMTLGMNYYENKKNNLSAIKAFQSALQVEKFCQPYYYLGWCYWKQEQIEDAIAAFAKAAVLQCELSGQAKEQLEKLYKSLHNNTLVGIDKVYNKAKIDLKGGP